MTLIEPDLSTVDSLWCDWLRDPCNATRNRLVEHYSDLVRVVARQVNARLKAADFNDLASAGSRMLIACVEEFDPSIGVPFEKYAARRLKGAMIDDLRRDTWEPRRRRRQRRALEAAGEAIAHRQQRTPTADELAAATGFTTEEITALSDTWAVVSLDTGLEETDAFCEATADPAAHLDTEVPVVPGFNRSLGDLRRYLGIAVDRLEPRHRFVLALVYRSGSNLTELATVLGCSVAWMSSSKTEAIEALRREVRAAAIEAAYVA